MTRSALTRPFVLLAVVVAASVASAQGQRTPSPGAALQQARTTRDVTYVKVNGWEGRLDVMAAPTSRAVPTVIYFHGGGWVRGTKEAATSDVTPFLQIGYSVVNVEYRLGREAPAPAAIEDCRCALKWLGAHAEEYGIDAGRIIVAGDSAGGHLALMTGLTQPSDGFDRNCPDGVVPPVSAIVDFYGITDVAELVGGPGKPSIPESWPYAAEWVGTRPDAMAVARRASPLEYVRAGAPPLFVAHGEADTLVPHDQSVRLVAAARRAGIPHKFMTVAAGGHGNFPPSEWRRIYNQMQVFLTAHGLNPQYSLNLVR